MRFHVWGQELRWNAFLTELQGFTILQAIKQILLCRSLSESDQRLMWNGLLEISWKKSLEIIHTSGLAIAMSCGNESNISWMLWWNFIKFYTLELPLGQIWWTWGVISSLVLLIMRSLSLHDYHEAFPLLLRAWNELWKISAGWRRHATRGANYFNATARETRLAVWFAGLFFCWWAGLNKTIGSVFQLHGIV